MNARITPPLGAIRASINLPSSKSIGNRAMMIRALCTDDFQIKNLSDADDSMVLKNALEQIQLSQNEQTILNVNHCGTAMRFLLSLCSITKGNWILEGSVRMHQRPVGILVDALRELGANVEYLETPGYPPLKISGSPLKGGKLKIQGDVSSQYISALLMIAPLLDSGLEIIFTTELVSKPYITMTINLMEYFGVKCKWTTNTILVKPQKYIAKEIKIEHDWSAASYWYEIVALSANSIITLPGLNCASWQGDAYVAQLFNHFGVKTTFASDEIVISKTNQTASAGNNTAYSNFDLSDTPDLAQTIASTAAGLGAKTKLFGLTTLGIKETHRIQAMESELSKLGSKIKSTSDSLAVESEITLSTHKNLKTYQDHRMAMCLAPLCLKTGEIVIENPNVVNKSYPHFWQDLIKSGFGVKYTV